MTFSKKQTMKKITSYQRQNLLSLFIFPLISSLLSFSFNNSYLSLFIILLVRNIQCWSYYFMQLSKLCIMAGIMIWKLWLNNVHFLIQRIFKYLEIVSYIYVQDWNKDSNFLREYRYVTHCHVIANLKFEMWFIKNRMCNVHLDLHLMCVWFKWAVGLLSVNRNL